MKVENKTYYHICVYPEFELYFGQDYNTVRKKNMVESI